LLEKSLLLAPKDNSLLLAAHLGWDVAAQSAAHIGWLSAYERIRKALQSGG